MAKAAAIWTAFERRAKAPLYQTFLWCRAWLETCGKVIGAEPRIVAIADADGQIHALLPLQIRRRMGLRVLEWLGSPQLGYGYGLYSGAALQHRELWVPHVFARVLDIAGPCDAIALMDMPGCLFGEPHPLAPWFNTAGANLSFAVALAPGFDTLLHRKRNGEDRRATRKKESGLARLGEVRFGLPRGKVETHAVLDIMFAQQKARMAELGVHGVSSTAERAFFHRLVELQDDVEPVLLPYHFTCGGETLAVMLGGQHANTYWALITALSGSAFRKYSPGDLALRRTIRACCEAGLDQLDFATGDSAYKRAWADDVITLHHYLSAYTLRGFIWISAMAAGQCVKRAVKTTPALMSLWLHLRRRLFGKRASAQDAKTESSRRPD